LAGRTDIACIVLAAGRSTRMGAANKLTADVGGKPMVRCAAEAALASGASPVLVVTGHQGDEVRAALAGLDLSFVHNPDYAEGLSTSLKAGIRALPEDVLGALVLLGDMPRIQTSHLARLITVFNEHGGQAIVVPTHAGKRGNPVLWPRALFAEMLQLDGVAGARRLFSVHADRIRGVDLGTDTIFLDIDTPDALAQLRGRSD
jgi:molybdenum cofactor cytidylyltransferase